jgi:hypothetical protein
MAWVALVPPCCLRIWFMRWYARRTFDEYFRMGAAGPLPNHFANRILAFGHLACTFEFWPLAAVGVAD